MKLGIAILAAGRGTRMNSCRPKVLHPLAGKPLLGHVLDTAQALAPARICVIYGHHGAQVRKAFEGRPCNWILQEQQQGTGHALLQAKEALAELDRVLVLFGDVPLIRTDTLSRLLTEAADADLGLLTVQLEDPTGYGRILRDEAGRVRGIVEQGDADARELAIREVNTGILVARGAKLWNWLNRIGQDNAQGEYYLTDIVALAAAEGVSIATTQPRVPEEVLGVNDRLQLAKLERWFQYQQAEALLRQGVSLLDPHRIDIRGVLRVGRDVTLDINCLIEGEVQLGDGVSVGPNCCLKNCIIGAHTEILAHSVIEGARIGESVRIGPFARIRPQTVLSDRVRVGNFVEVKQSHIGRESKLNHLSYVGDARIGNAVNLGAGTITCNYDGVQKHRTEIGDRAFIGSNTALVAPVQIGEDATIGAGSVIVRTAPPGKLTLARSRQHTIDHWTRPKKKS